MQKGNEGHRCLGCGQTFTTSVGLGLHFTWQRRKHGVGCGEARKRPQSEHWHHEGDASPIGAEYDR